MTSPSRKAKRRATGWRKLYVSVYAKSEKARITTTDETRAFIKPKASASVNDSSFISYCHSNRGFLEIGTRM